MARHPATSQSELYKTPTGTKMHNGLNDKNIAIFRMHRGSEGHDERKRRVVSTSRDQWMPQWQIQLHNAVTPDAVSSCLFGETEQSPRFVCCTLVMSRTPFSHSIQLYSLVCLRSSHAARRYLLRAAFHAATLQHAIRLANLRSLDAVPGDRRLVEGVSSGAHQRFLFALDLVKVGLLLQPDLHLLQLLQFHFADVGLQGKSEQPPISGC